MGERQTDSSGGQPGCGGEHYGDGGEQRGGGEGRARVVVPVVWGRICWVGGGRGRKL